nr:uncharacterized protein LOC113802898 [Penaeus vannamei]
MTSYYIPIVAVTTIILAASLLDLTLLGLEEGVDPASRGLLRLRREATGDEARRDAVTEGRRKRSSGETRFLSSPTTPGWRYPVASPGVELRGRQRIHYRGVVVGSESS